MNTRSMTRQRNAAIMAAIERIPIPSETSSRSSRHAALSPLLSLPTIAASSRKYNLRPRTVASYAEDADFFYANDAKDPDYVPYVHISGSSRTSSDLPTNSASFHSNISAFIAEANALSYSNSLYSDNQLSQSNTGVSHRRALRSYTKK